MQTLHITFFFGDKEKDWGWSAAADIEGDNSRAKDEITKELSAGVNCFVFLLMILLCHWQRFDLLKRVKVSCKSLCSEGAVYKKTVLKMESFYTKLKYMWCFLWLVIISTAFYHPCVACVWDSVFWPSSESGTKIFQAQCRCKNITIYSHGPFFVGLAFRTPCKILTASFMACMCPSISAAPLPLSSVLHSIIYSQYLFIPSPINSLCPACPFPSSSLCYTLKNLWPLHNINYAFKNVLTGLIKWHCSPVFICRIAIKKKISISNMLTSFHGSWLKDSSATQF